jgi:predicted N-formylglutamate amidohydrolase
MTGKRKSTRRPVRLLLTCEHGGNRVPPEYAKLFRNAIRTLQSHRAWDLGALDLARRLGRTFEVPVLAVTWSRLLVESNRAPSNWRIWSEFTASLAADEKARILDRYWWPHRRTVDAEIERLIAEGNRIVHVAVHSFTPVMSGIERNADIGLLYDSRRSAERALCTRWQEILEELHPTVRVRRNYPYIGATDGFPTWLRRRHAPDEYVGIELEINQAMFAKHPVSEVHRVIATSLERLLANP